MKFHLGYIVGLIIGLSITFFIFVNYQNTHLHTICSPIVSKIVSVFDNKEETNSLNEEKKEENINKIKEDPIKSQIKRLFSIETNISCPKDLYSILKFNEIDKINSCIKPKGSIYLSVIVKNNTLNYDYLYDLKDGIYVLKYYLDNVYLPVLYYQNNNETVYDEKLNIIKITNYPIPKTIQRELFIKYLSEFLKKNYSENAKDQCFYFSYPKLKINEIGNKTIYILAKKINSSIKGLNKNLNLINVLFNDSNNIYSLEVCFGTTKLFNNLDKKDLNAKSIKELSNSLCKYNNSLRNAYEILKWVDNNFEYDDERAKEILKNNKNKVIPPEKMLKLKKGICTDYSVFIDSVLLNCNITPYYLNIEYYNQDYGHAVPAIKYNNTLYILDQHLPIMDLKNYILKSHYCDGKSFKKIYIYQLDSNGDKKLKKIIARFDYNNLAPNEINFNLLKNEVMNMIKNKYNIESYSGEPYYGRYLVYYWDLNCTKYGLTNPTAKYYLFDLFNKALKEADINPYTLSYFNINFNVSKNNDYSHDFGLKYNIHLYGG